MTDYTKLVEDLRDIKKTMFALGTSPINMDNVSIRLAYDKKWGRTDNDAAAAIEALQAQLPKLGEWQKAKPKGVVTYSDGYAECSHCHETIWLGWGMNFCPHCGTQNRIIDPDDMAKMGGTDADRPD